VGSAITDSGKQAILKYYLKPNFKLLIGLEANAGERRIIPL
jgi:hypothetical protein